MGKLRSTEGEGISHTMEQWIGNQENSLLQPQFPHLYRMSWAFWDSVPKTEALGVVQQVGAYTQVCWKGWGKGGGVLATPELHSAERGLSPGLGAAPSSVLSDPQDWPWQHAWSPRVAWELGSPREGSETAETGPPLPLNRTD